MWLCIINPKVKCLETHQDGVALQILKHLLRPLFLPNLHVFWKEKSPPNSICHLSSPNLFAFEDQIFFVYRPALNVELTLPRLFRVVSVLMFMRHMTCGLLKSSTIFVFSLFGWGFSFGRFGEGQSLLTPGFSNFFFSPLPLPHYELPLREPRRRREGKSLRRFRDECPQYGSYVDGQFLDKHGFVWIWSGVKQRGESNDW